MSSFVSAFSPIYPVVETKISGREVENDGSIKPSRELTVESTTYDQRGRVVMNQNYTVEIWI